MFNPKLRQAFIAGVVSRIKPNQATVKTQTSSQKKKKKVNQTSGGVQVQRGGKGRRSLIST